jgi:hypothetical protein
MGDVRKSGCFQESFCELLRIQTKIQGACGEKAAGLNNCEW